MLTRPDTPTPSAIPTQQRRTFLVHLKRQAQSLKDATIPPKSSSSAAPSTPPVHPEAAESESARPVLQTTNLPYFIRRTGSNQLPIYLLTKAGGTKQQTLIRKTEGDMEALKSDLATYLGLPVNQSRSSKAAKGTDIAINSLTGHIVVKVCYVACIGCGFIVRWKWELTAVQGWRKPEISKFLLERHF